MSKKLCWSSGFTIGNLEIPIEAVEDIAQQGSNDEAVEFWLPKIDFSSYTKELLSVELSEYGLNDGESRQHMEERLLWIASWDLAQECKEEENGR
tara:strand:+ start:109 stop:393 length:285 start_codon:yes stop_codon:yes gene_type:complete